MQTIRARNAVPQLTVNGTLRASRVRSESGCQAKQKGSRWLNFPRTHKEKWYSLVGKCGFIQQNRDFYAAHEARLRDWLPKVKAFRQASRSSNGTGRPEAGLFGISSSSSRASGIRVKNPATAPSLVALTTSQVPIIAWERRYMTIRECARLQSLGDLAFLPTIRTRAFRALGNAVNADVVYLVAREFLKNTRGGVREQRGNNGGVSKVSIAGQ